MKDFSTLPDMTRLGDGRAGLIRTLTVTTQAVGEEREFIASNATLDRYHEVVSLSGWKLDAYRANPVVLDSHTYDTIGRIVGRSTLIEVRDQALVNRVRFALENPLGKLAHDLSAGGFLNAESVGFIPLEWEGGQSPTAPRIYTRQELLEISLVAVPANPEALSLALRSGAISRSKLGDCLDLLKTLCSTETSAASTGAPGHGDNWAPMHAALRDLKRVLLA